MLSIDGAQGEGGGQVLRTALTMAALTGQPVEITDIRAGRSRPGLRAQHLTAVEALAEVTGADTQGARLGSTHLVFAPGMIRPGSFRFDIGTAGATTLVMQALTFPLSAAGEVSTVAVTGGTHVPWSPCYHYLDWHWLPVLQRLGYDARLVLKRAGFYPPGGGRLQATIRPSGQPAPLEWVDRGPLRRLRGLSAAANLPGHIIERQRRQTRRRLKDRYPIEVDMIQLQARSPGTFLLLLAEFDHGQYCTFALGQKGLPAERVADLAVDDLESFLETGAAVDRHMADQLLLPLALASGPSRFTTQAVTGHLTTNAAVIEAFGQAHIQIEGQMGQPGLVHVLPG